MSSLLLQRGLALLLSCILLRAGSVPAQPNPDPDRASVRASAILQRVADHDFNPLRDGFTFDRQLNKHGVASLGDQDWLIRTLAVRDLVRFGTPAAPALTLVVNDTNRHVHQVAVMVLGILQATKPQPTSATRLHPWNR